MSRWVVNHPYWSWRDGQQWGPWVEGDVVDLADVDAEWVNRDSPGALVAEGAPEPESAPARQQRPAANRQHRGGRTRGA